jgi:hypothetical protein
LYTGIHLYIHLPAIHAYTNSASSVANRDDGVNSYPYIYSKAYSHAEACTITEASPDAGSTPVA